MENASKALLMAAGVLISVAVLSLGIYLVATFGSSAASIEEENRRNQVAQFNQQFLSYQGKDDTTIYDVISLANLARQNNENYSLTTSDAGENSYYITINVKLANGRLYSHFENTASEVSNQSDILLSEVDSNGDLQKYTCTEALISSSTGRVYSLTFYPTGN